MGTALATGVAVTAWNRMHAQAPAADPAAAARAALRAPAAEGDRAALAELLRLRIDDPGMPRSVAARLETLYWAERAASLDDAATLRRVRTFIERECRDPAIDWHWLCRSGE